MEEIKFTYYERDKEKAKKYREDNKDKLAQRKKEWRKNNKEKISQKKKEYYERNKEKAAQWQKKYRENNKDKIKEKEKEYRENNKEKAKEYRENNKEKAKEYNKKWIQNNRNYWGEWYENNKYKKKEYNKKWIQNNRDKDRHRNMLRRQRKKQVNDYIPRDIMRIVYNKFNHQCFNCSSAENLHIDHHYPLSKGFALTITNAVLLCRRCNSSKWAKLPEEFYTKKQLNDLELNYGISKSPFQEK